MKIDARVRRRAVRGGSVWRDLVINVFCGWVVCATEGYLFLVNVSEKPMWLRSLFARMCVVAR